MIEQQQLSENNLLFQTVEGLSVTSHRVFKPSSSDQSTY